MSFSLAPEDVRKSTEVPKKPYAIGLAVLLAVGVLGLGLIGNFSYSQRSNALLGVQQVMEGVADVRVGAVSEWVRQQESVLARFADDQDVRLGMMQIAEPSADLDLSSRSYLRNWLTALARDYGYLPDDKLAGELGVNARGSAPSGMAVFDQQGKLVVSVGNFSLNTEAVKSYVASYTVGTLPMLDLFLGKDNKAYIGFAAPVFGVSSGGDEKDRLGLVIGIKPVDSELWPLLGQPGAMLKSGQAVLLRKHADTVEILSPSDNFPALGRQFGLDHDNLVEVRAVLSPGEFAEGRDSQGVPTLGVSRAVPGTPWVVSYQARYDELMLATDSRLFYQKVIFFVLLVAVLALLYGAWRRGAAKIASEKAVEYAALARKFDFQGRLLRLVTDSQRNHIMISDSEGRVRFANATLARDMGMVAEDMLGKPMAAAVGAVSARRFAKRAQEALLSNRAVVTVDRIDITVAELAQKTGKTEAADKPVDGAVVDVEQDGSEIVDYRVVQTQHIPLVDNSLGPDLPPTHGTLIVEEDITTLVKEREKRERVLRGVVDALVSVVDRRDPYAAEHSGRVARLSRMVALEMDLSPVECETVELAGALLNLGKMLVPAQVLTKEGVLDDAEMRVVRDSLQASADIVSAIDFEGPVVDTMRQSMERVDGSGYPSGLSGDGILLTARIVAVANTFVALISSRAHRIGKSVDQAIEILMSGVDKSFDRGVVAALVSYMDNKGGRDEWELIAPPPEDDLPADENPWMR